MASLAEMIYQNASRSVDTAASRVDTQAMNKGLQAGAELALGKQKIEMQKVKLQNQKALLAAKQDEFGIKELATYSKLPPKLRKTYVKQMERKAQERGRPYAPEFLQGLNSMNVDAGLVSDVVNEYQAAFEESLRLGEPTERLSTARSNYADVAYGGDLNKLAGLEEDRKRENIRAEAQVLRQQTQIEAAAAAKEREYQQFPVKEKQKKVTAAATKFIDSGGFGKQAEIIRKAKEIRKQLADGTLKTGTGKLAALTMFPIGEQRTKIGVFAPDVAAAMDRAQALINVKNALDSQFGDAMAIRVFSRIFDPTAPKKYNIERLDDFIKTAQEEARGKKALMDEAGYRYDNYNTEIFGEAPARKREQEDIDGMADAAQIEKATSIIAADPELSAMSQDELGDELRRLIPNITDAQINSIIKNAKKPEKRQ